MFPRLASRNDEALGFTLPGGGNFDPDFGLDSEFTPSEDLSSNFPDLQGRSREILDRYGYEKPFSSYAVDGVRTLSSEVGDDEEVVANTPLFAVALIQCHEFMGVIPSWPDTAIHPKFGNFCEDLIILPSVPEQTWQSARNNSRPQNMAFLDVVKLRLAIGIRPMRMTHSDTNDGKVNMVARRMAWIPSKSPIRGTWEIFSLFQDLELGLIRDKKFAWFPEQLGGYGKPLPFNNPDNLEKISLSFRQGTYAELHREIIRRFNSFLFKLRRNMDPARDPLLSHVLRFQGAWHDWIKGRSVFSPTVWVEAPPWVENYVAIRPQNSSRTLDNVAARLVASGHLVQETTLKVALEHNELCQKLLEQQNMSSFMEEKAAKTAEWRNLSIYSLREYGYIEEIPFESHKTLLEPREVLDFYESAIEQRFNLKALLKAEPVYYREALDMIYEQGPMKVKVDLYPQNLSGNLTYRFNPKLHPRDTEDERKIGAYDQLYSWLQTDRSSPIPRTLISDDEAIIERMVGEIPLYQGLILVTEDKKLCRKINFELERLVVRVPCRWYWSETFLGDGSKIAFEQRVRNEYPQYDWRLMIDTGSYESQTENIDLLDFDQAMVEQPIGTYPIDQRFDFKPDVEFDMFDPLEKPPNFPKGFLFDYRNHLRTYTTKRSFRPKQTRSDSNDWIADRELSLPATNSGVRVPSPLSWRERRPQ